MERTASARGPRAESHRRLPGLFLQRSEAGFVLKYVLPHWRAQRLEKPAEIPGIPAFDDHAVLEGEPGHSTEFDLAICRGHAEAVAAMGSADSPAHDDVISVGCCVFDFDLHVGEGVQESFASGLELGRALVAVLRVADRARREEIGIPPVSDLVCSISAPHWTCLCRCRTCRLRRCSGGRKKPSGKTGAAWLSTFRLKCLTASLLLCSHRPQRDPPLPMKWREAGETWTGKLKKN
jgi:hypothetical protein